MTARTSVALASVAIAALAASCVNYYEIGVEVPIQAKFDVGAYQRVLVPGFLAGGTNDVDANAETVRLLRSQLRTKSDLKVIDSDVFSLADVVDKAQGTTTAPASSASASATATPAAAAAANASAQNQKFKSQKDFEPYEPIFADVTYWKKLGEEFQGPLIVTGEILFVPIERSGFVETPQSTIDEFGRQTTQTTRVYRDQRGFSLTQKIIFIDGRTGVQLHTEEYTDETLYPSTQNTPALSAYFELMDRRIQDFLNTLSSQKIHGSRFLLK
jgi:hypothetical protein